MSSVPSTKDVYIAERLAKLKDSNNNDDNFPLLLPPPPPSTLPSLFSSRRRAKSNDDGDDDGRNLTPTQVFLLNQPQRERTAIAVGESVTTSKPLQVKPRKVKFSENLNKVFSKVNDIFESCYQPSILKKEKITVLNI